MNKLSIAMLSTILLPIASYAQDQKGITFSAMLGYHYLEGANDKQKVALDRISEQGQAVKDDIAEEYALGYMVNPNLTTELNYSQTQALASTPSLGANDTHDAREQHYTLNLLLSQGTTLNGRLRPYLLLGGGQSVLETKAFSGDRKQINETKDTIGNLGLGTLYKLNHSFAARAELRAVRNFDHDWWEGLALLGVQYGWYWGNTTPVIVRTLVVPPAKVVVDPVPHVVIQLDSDHDGVVDPADQCPNTIPSTIVDAVGCPIVKAPTSVDLKVYFDTNSANVKTQYLTAVRGAAKYMEANSNVNALIEGHTDNRGSRLLNERLSLSRANAVKSILVTYYGLTPVRLSTAGYADMRPVASNATEVGRAMNRRVMAVFSEK